MAFPVTGEQHIDRHVASRVGIGAGLFLCFSVAFSPLYLRSLVGVVDARIAVVVALLAATSLLVFSYPRRAASTS